MPHTQDTRETGSATEPKAPDATALRMLNLLFMLHAAQAPLATGDIIGNAETGYGGRRDSELRKFKRDRDRLKDLGVLINEVKPAGASEREESRWEIDRAHTHAPMGSLGREDIEAVLSAIDGHFSLHANDPVRWPLQRARAKLLEMAQEAESACGAGAQRENAELRHIWSAYRRRKAARFTYRPNGRTAQKRSVEVYAMFTQGSHTYLVGRCVESGLVRTFRTDRILSAQKTSDKEPTYEIPDDFRPEGFRFLPFDFSPDRPFEARFSFPANANVHELELLTNGRGSLGRGAGGRWVWTVDVRDARAAAAFALRHASRGMVIDAPTRLASLRDDLIRKAMMAHGA